MLNATASRAAKEQGMHLALSFAGDDWKDRALVELRAWCAVHWAQGNTEMTMEQFRAQAVNQPARHHAWGPLAVSACKAGIIQALAHPDGSPVMRRAESVRTHAHPVRLYKILAASFASGWAKGAKSPASHDGGSAVSCNAATALSRVGEGRVSHCEEHA